MLRTIHIRRFVLLGAVSGMLVVPLTAQAQGHKNRAAVVTIYNHTGVQLRYQLRPKWHGAWGDWRDFTHTHTNGGWQSPSFVNATAIQIRFDRIGGDGEYTEKVYDLQFNTVNSDSHIGRYTGRPYYFQFDRGGQLLKLYRYRW